MINALKRTGLSWIWLSIIALILDQVTKIWVSTNFYLGETVELIPFLNVRYALNPGAAFSFLGDAGGWQRWLFTAIASIISLLLLWWLYKLKKEQYLLCIAYSLILSGAIGNLIDRVSYGHVIDFIDVYYQAQHWPTFNIADSAICIGAVLILIEAFLGHKKQQSN